MYQSANGLSVMAIGPSTFIKPFSLGSQHVQFLSMLCGMLQQLFKVNSFCQAPGRESIVQNLTICRSHRQNGPTMAVGGISRSSFTARTKGKLPRGATTIQQLAWRRRIGSTTTDPHICPEPEAEEKVGPSPG